MDSQEKIDSYFFSKINKKIVSVCKKIEDIKGIAPEIVIFVIWTVIHFVVSAYHERWFDEAVAWQIAKNATLKDLLFTVPHYEGHAPLWHLVLRIFAKSGIDYNLSMSIVTYIFMGTTILLLFKTSLPRSVKLLIPFLYFPLYQYGIISRPYCILALAFVLLGIAHKSRNEKPFKYVSCLFLLCLTCAYGIVLSFGICLVWLGEIFFEDEKSIKKMIADSRVRWLVVLAVLVFAEGILMIPAKDRYASFTASGEVGIKGMAECILYLFIVIPADSVFTDVISDYALMPYYNFSFSNLLLGSIVGIIIIICIFFWGRRKGTFWYIAIPHILFATFSSVVYFCVHHMGIWFFLFLFWIIISCDSEVKIESKAYGKILPIVNSIYSLVLMLVICVSMFQGISSCLMDLNKPYSEGKELAEYLEANDLKNYKVMATWYADYEQNANDPDNPVLKNVYTEMTGADEINAYLGYNIFYNVNNGDDAAYNHHKVYSLDESRIIADGWKAQGYPDILVGYPDLEYVFGEKDLVDKHYSAVFVTEGEQIWKGFANNYTKTYIYMKNELADKLGIKKLRTSFF